MDDVPRSAAELSARAKSGRRRVERDDGDLESRSKEVCTMLVLCRRAGRRIGSVHICKMRQMIVTGREEPPPTEGSRGDRGEGRGGGGGCE